MQVERCQDLSVYYWVKSVFSDMPFLTVVDGYPEEDIDMPCVAIEWNKLMKTPFELGNREGLVSRVFTLDIFAVNKSQRDEIGYRLANSLENKIDVYDYNVGFPPNVTPPKVGFLDCDEIEMTVIPVFPAPNTNIYYRAVISYTALYNKVGGE